MPPSLTLAVAAHPRLQLGVFAGELPAPLAQLPSPEWLRAQLRPDAGAAGADDEAVRAAVRDVLRVHGYKPTGRGKPASEYLRRAAAEGRLASINLAVDACNAVSLASGLPSSVVDLDRLRPPLRVDVAKAGAAYVFNLSGQTIDVEGLPCLFDADGPCANAVKDAQRTKTGADTRRLLCLVWGARSLGALGERTVARYREILERAGARTSDVAVTPGPGAE